MVDNETILEWNDAGLLAEVVGYEMTEVAQEAHGTTVRTLSGREFVDFTGGIAVHACGHGQADISEAIVRQARAITHVSDTMRHAPQLELAAWMRDLFCDLVGGEPWQFLFMNSGSESIDAAAKLALKATGRPKLAAFRGAFHGRTMFASALSRSKTLHWSAYETFLAPLRENILHAPAPRCRNCQLTRNAESCCGNGLEAILQQHGHEIAAVFLEAEQGEGGYLPMSPFAAQKIRELTRQYGVLLICDEIQSGWGRTGAWFGWEHLGIVPDMVVFGKAVGGGLPLAGVAAPGSLMATWAIGEHGTTFGGNPIACAAGLAALKCIAADGLIANAERLGEQIKSQLRPLIGQHGVVDVRGLGLMIGLELRDDAGNPDYARCEAVKLRCREASLMLLTCGAKIGDPLADNSTIRLIPPLNTPDAVADAAVATLIQALADTPR